MYHAMQRTLRRTKRCIAGPPRRNKRESVRRSLACTHLILIPVIASNHFPKRSAQSSAVQRLWPAARERVSDQINSSAQRRGVNELPQARARLSPRPMSQRARTNPGGLRQHRAVLADRGERPVTFLFICDPSLVLRKKNEHEVHRRFYACCEHRQIARESAGHTIRMHTLFLLTK